MVVSRESKYLTNKHGVSHREQGNLDRWSRQENCCKDQEDHKKILQRLLSVLQLNIRERNMRE